MPVSRGQRAGILLVLLLLVGAAPAAAHNEDGSLSPEEAPDAVAPPNAGYTGPGPAPWISFFEGVWLYGKATVTRLGDQEPRHVRGHGDWLVWEDARRADIFAFNLRAGDGFYVTQDAAAQHNPDVDDGVVVWEDYRHGTRPHVYAHFLETGETRRLTDGPGSHRNPAVAGGLVAWEDDRARNADVWAKRLDGGEEFPVAATEDRETDPLLLDGVVYYRTYRFNVWDVMGHDPARNQTFPVSSDVAANGAPFTNGRDVLFLTQAEAGWVLERYDPQRDRLARSPLRFATTAPTPAAGDHLLQTVRDVGYHQVVARNLTSGATNHVTGNLRLVTDPHLDGRTAYLFVATRNGTQLLTLDVSPFAFARHPTLTITSPLTGTPWLRPVAVQGVLQAGPDWTAPLTFTYRLDNGAPQTIPPGREWQVVLDPAGIEPGNHLVTVRATFREGPPVEAAITLVLPQPVESLDVAEAAALFHAARLHGAYRKYLADNAGSWFLLALVLVLLALVALRVWLHVRVRRAPVRIEYVAPDD